MSIFRIVELVNFAVAARESGRRTLAAVYLRQARRESVESARNFYPRLRARGRVMRPGRNTPAPHDSQVPVLLKQALGLL